MKLKLIHKPVIFILVLAMSVAPVFAQDFNVEDLGDEERESIYVIMPVMLLSGTVGYFGGALLAAGTTSAVCSACIQFGERYNAVQNSTAVLGTTLITASFVSATGKLFAEPSYFWYTTAGAFLGSLVFPLNFYTTGIPARDRAPNAFLVAAVPTVLGAITGYFMAYFLFSEHESDKPLPEKNKAGFSFNFSPGGFQARAFSYF